MKTLAMTALTFMMTAGLTGQAFAANSFPVSAKWKDGKGFRNSSSSPVTIEFVASGKWNHDPKEWYSYGPGGNGEWAPPNLRLPGYAGGRVGALIVRRGNGRLEHVGARRTITLLPGERIVFMINDHRDYYRDNSGSVYVAWFVR